MRQRLLSLLLFAMTAACSAGGGTPPTAAASSDEPSSPTTSATFVEGRDYTVLERARFLDTAGFEQPAEAFSVLLPRGWTHEGGVVWKSLQECRGEMVGTRWSAASPDDAIRYQALPLHAWGSASDPMMLQALQMHAQNGGCDVGQPVAAEQYLRQMFAPRELAGATITEVRVNEEATGELQRIAGESRARLEQYGGQVQMTADAVIARLRWDDGSEGLALCSVLNVVTTMQNAFTGGMQRLSNSSAPERSFIRFRPERRAEAETFLANLKSSYRTNPQWKAAVDDYFARMREQQNAVHHQRMQALAEQTAANARAHAQRMADIAQQGAANTQRHEQRMNAMDQGMRSWESQQSSQDRMHTSFVQTIREVETWQGGDGTVELGSGYGQAWSRGDGTYILSNSPSFDPRAAFQDQQWQELARGKP